MSLSELGIRLLPIVDCWLLTAVCITLNGQPACNISGGSESFCAASAIQECTLTITTQPLPQTDCYGNHVEFSVEVNGVTGNVRYQWQKKPPGGVFTDIAGAVSALLPVDNIGVNSDNIDGTEYRAVISDDCITLTSSPAVLHINAIVSITPVVVNSTICSGGSIAYMVATQGIVVSYQWASNNGSGWNSLSDGGAYSGATTPRLTISNANPAQTGSYRVSVTFMTLNQPPGYPTCIETSTTRTRNLMVRPALLPPVISSSQQICYGAIPASLSATPASGGTGPIYSYQWQTSMDGNSWSAITGATSLTFLPPATGSTTYYNIVATDSGTPSCGAVNSAPVIITIIPLPATSPIYHW